jgi:hypothetical protein
MSKKRRRYEFPLSMVELSQSLGHERDAILKSSAGLQLLPQNATKWMRFERLSEVAAGAAPEATQLPISGSRLRQFLNNPPIASDQVIANEDPFEESFVACVTYHGGNFRVVAGGASEAHASCQLLLSAAESLSYDFADFKNAVHKDATVLLALSEAMCNRAGLERWETCNSSQNVPVTIPSEAELQVLGEAACFKDEQLDDALGAMSQHVLNLVAPSPLGIVDHDFESPTDDRCYLYPLIELGDRSKLIAIPGAIAASVTHRALLYAHEFDCVDAVVAALHQAVLRAADAYLLRLRWQQILKPSTLSAPEFFDEAFYRFDDDKIAHVVSIVDPLDGYKAGKPFGYFDARAIQSELDSRIPEVRDAYRVQGVPTVLHVITNARLGREFAIGFRRNIIDESSGILTLSTDELDVITRIEAPEPLGLWRFASAAGHLRDRSRVQSFSQFDEYAIYLDNKRSFYMSDEAAPTGLQIVPGSGAALRMKERKRSDQHATLLLDDNKVVEVIRWPADDNTPIYRPVDPSLNALHLVELNLPCWVIPSSENPDEIEASEDFAETVAFWLWKCRDLLRPALTKLLETSPELKVRVRFGHQSPQSVVADVDPIASWLKCDVERVACTIRMTLLDGASSLMRGPGNEVERIVAGQLICAINEIANVESEGDVTFFAASLTHGPMKMMQVFGPEDDLFLALGYTAAPRLISSADVEILLDEVGAVASRIAGPGNVAADAKTALLNMIVAELFTKLRELLVTLRPEGLLETLAAEQEALTFMDARNGLLVPSQAACFGEDSSSVRKAIESGHELVQTGIANRFLIEFVTAIGPSGATRLSCGLYDQLIAIAREIVELGFLSDALRYELSTAEISVLPSGRLGISREEPYSRAIESFARARSGRALGYASSFFASHWAQPGEVSEPFDPTDLNNAFEAEFDVTAFEMSQLSGELIEISRGERRQISVWALEALVDHLQRELTWSDVKVRTGIALLSLGPLENYLPTTNAADSYPWRFSRDRSSVRRPLLQRPAGDQLEVVWGPRAVHRSGRYLLDQILADRLKPASTVGVES